MGRSRRTSRAGCFRSAGRVAAASRKVPADPSRYLYVTPRRFDLLQPIAIVRLLIDIATVLATADHTINNSTARPGRPGCSVFGELHGNCDGLDDSVRGLRGNPRGWA